MRKNNFFILLSASLLAIILPVAVLANCQWFPHTSAIGVGDKTCGGDSNWSKAADSLCLASTKTTGFDDCCCSKTNDAVGCCVCASVDNVAKERYFGHQTTAGYCATLKGNKLDGSKPSCSFTQGMVPLNGDYNENTQNQICVPYENACSWYIAEGYKVTCGLIDSRLRPAKNLSSCRESDKPAGFAICCCGANAVEKSGDTASSSPEAKVAALYDYSAVTNPLDTVSIPVVVGRIVRAVLLIIGSILLLVIIYGGFTWMSAAGNESKVAKGRKTLVWAVLGVIVVFLGWIITGFIFETLSVY